LFKPTKSKLSIIFLVLAFLPLIVLRLVVYPITFQTIKEEIIKNLEVAAHKQTELITKWMEKCVSDVQSIANNPIVIIALKSVTGNVEYTELLKYTSNAMYFDYLWREQGHREVFIADREGIVRLASKQELVGKNISSKDYYHSAIKGVFYNSNIVPSDTPIENETGTPEIGFPTMLISAPVKDISGTIVGVTVVRIDVSEINTMMQNIHLGKTGETYLINEKGYMLTESRFAEDLKRLRSVEKRTALEVKVVVPGTDNLTRGISECIKGSEGYDADGYKDYRGVNVLGFWQWMPDYGWGVIAEIDVDEGYGIIYTLRDYIMLVFGLVSIGVIVVAFFLGKKISAPIHHIAEVARKVASGDYNARVVYNSNDEIGELASSINKMAENLEEKAKKLE
jgi:HAMP domain-containing protein